MNKIQSILVATDLSEGSDDVVRAAAALAALTNAKLHVLHAFEFESKPYAPPDGKPLTFQKHVSRAKQALTDQIGRTVRGNVNVASQEVVIYIAFKAIRERAHAVNADLIVLARHRRRAVGDEFLGSTADRVIRSVDVPCLIVPGALSLPLRRILVPIDLSEPAMGALDVALRLSKSFGPSDAAPELTVLHVVPRVLDAADFVLDRMAITTEVGRAIAERKHDGSDAADLRVQVKWADSASEEILRFAQEETVDLIVIGTHGYGAVKRALIGGVASGVARSARQPVLMVPPTLWKDEAD
jgi:nucleotide-binding universal stress UspA family protein